MIFKIKTFILFSFMLLCAAPLQAQSDTLLIGIHENPPFIIKNDKGEYQGLSVELWKNIAEELKLAYEFRPYYDLVSILKSLEYREIDLTINPMNVTALRVKKFDLTQPYFISSIGVVTPYVQQNQLWSFVQNFFSVNFFKIVLLLVFIIFIFGALLWLVERKVNNNQFRPGVWGLLDGLWWSAVTMTTVGYGDKAPTTTAGKIIAIIWMFTAIIIISGFTASIASTLTIGRLTTDIENLEDLKLSKSIVSVGTSTGEDFMLVNEIPLHQTYQNPLQALRAVAKGKGEVLVFDRTILQYLINTYKFGDKVQLLPISFNKQYESFMLPKDHPKYDVINSALVHQIQEVSWQQLLQRYSLGEQ